jgi:hypothetical protein
VWAGTGDRTLLRGFIQNVLKEANIPPKGLVVERERGGGDRSSRPAQVQARENEQKALSIWIKGATFQQIAAAGFGIATPSGAWRAVHRALARIPKQEADQARQAQLARLQTIRMHLWNHSSTDPIRAAEALIKLEAREARLLGLDMPSKLEVTQEGHGIPLEAMRELMNRGEQEPIDVTPEPEGGRLLTDGKSSEDL